MPKKGGKSNAIYVAVRARPLNSREKGLKSAVCISMSGNTTTITKHSEGKEGDARQFTYDQSYWWDEAQDKVYNDLGKGTIEKAIEGFNGTVFAYGQTGSGKTYSMMGYNGDGIIPRLNKDLMGAVKTAREKDPSNEFLVTVSYLEIYNEVVKDLLNPSDKHLKIREHPDMGIYVEGLAELVVENEDSIAELIEQGNKVRAVAATQMNARSSRSHSCFTIKINQRKKEDLGNGQERTTKLASKLNLVDLAGSERAGKTGASGAQLKEGAAINKSLSALGNVISTLSSGKRGAHIPYRDSKLTRLLQESLGGNSRTVMIATISPAADNYEETMTTLKYAERAKKIENKAKRNEDVSQKVIRQLKEEIEELRRQLAAAAAAGGSKKSSSFEDDEEEDEAYLAMEEKIANLERAKKETWEEKQKLSMAFQQEREKNLKNENYVRNVMQTVKQENVDLIKRALYISLCSFFFRGGGGGGGGGGCRLCLTFIFCTFFSLHSSNPSVPSTPFVCVSFLFFFSPLTFDTTGLKALQREKNELTTKFKGKKTEYSAMKKSLEVDMLQYSQVMKEGAEAGHTDEDALAHLLSQIELKRQNLLQDREELKRIQRDLAENDERQTEERAEMSAQKSVIQQDKQLRSQIAEEERKKFLEEKQSYMDQVLDKERAR